MANPDPPQLRVAHCLDAACTSYTVKVIGPSGNAESSLTIGADAMPLIAYAGNAGGLRVAHCADFVCASATNYSIDASSSTGYYNSITVGTDGLGIISYNSGTNLKVAHCSNGLCSSAIVSTVAPAGGSSPSSITIGPDGLGLIGYHNTDTGGLRVLHCGNQLCSAASRLSVDTSSSESQPSITIGTDGLALIAYADEGGAISVTHLSDRLGVRYHRRR